jgi:Flp pilus assembly CpaE family ATPase
MFNTIVFHGSPDRAPLLRAIVASSGLLSVMREHTNVPGTYELSRLMNTLVPDVVLVDLSGGPQMLDCASQIRQLSPRVAMIACACTPELLKQVTQIGFDSAVPPQTSPEDLRLAVREALEHTHAAVERYVYSFLPSKAGSGCSTIVLNTAIAMQRLGKRVLVIDADMRSGILAIMLGVEPSSGGLQGVLAHSDELDQFSLRNASVTVQGVDFLFSTRATDTPLPEWHQYYQLLNFSATRYDAILVDLPELINPATRELVRRSRMLFPVCTPEIPALRLTMRRCQEIAALSIPDAQLGLLVNRWHRTDPPIEQLAALLGKPILRTFPNDYPMVRDAIAEGRGVVPESELGRAFTDFAAHLAELTPPRREQGFGARLKGMLGLTPR